MTFFKRQTELPQCLPDQTDARRHGVSRRQPCTQLFDRPVRPFGDAGADRAIQWCQLRRHVIALRSCGRFTGSPPSRQDLGDLGDTDPEQLRDLANAVSFVRCSEYPLPQVLRICLARLIQHRAFPVVMTGDARITHQPRFATPRDSAQGENALALYSVCC